MQHSFVHSVQKPAYWWSQKATRMAPFANIQHIKYFGGTPSRKTAAEWRSTCTLNQYWAVTPVTWSQMFLSWSFDWTIFLNPFTCGDIWVICNFHYIVYISYLQLWFCKLYWTKHCFGIKRENKLVTTFQNEMYCLGKLLFFSCKKKVGICG